MVAVEEALTRAVSEAEGKAAEGAEVETRVTEAEAKAEEAEARAEEAEAAKGRAADADKWAMAATEEASARAEEAEAKAAAEESVEPVGVKCQRPGDGSRPPEHALGTAIHPVLLGGLGGGR